MLTASKFAALIASTGRKQINLSRSIHSCKNSKLIVPMLLWTAIDSEFQMNDLQPEMCQIVGSSHRGIWTETERETLITWEYTFPWGGEKKRQKGARWKWLLSKTIFSLQPRETAETGWTYYLWNETCRCQKMSDSQTVWRLVGHSSDWAEILEMQSWSLKILSHPGCGSHRCFNARNLLDERWKNFKNN